MSSRSRLHKVISLGADKAGDALENALDRVNKRTVRLAVTGLSRAGKTIFTTALVHNLIRFPSRRQILPAIADLDNITAAVERPHRDPGLAAFPYLANLDAITADPPHWPPSTNLLSEMRLEVHYRPRSWLRRRVTGQAVLNIDIIDYPGEWLLDLPLLSLNYQAWSAQTLGLAQRAPRDRLAGQWLGLLSAANPGGAADDSVIRALSASYKDYLRSCAEPSLGLTLTQPGRFLRPGPWDPAAPNLNFCPMPRPEGRSPSRDSLYAAMAGRYDAYRNDVVREFYEKHFRNFDRQIVLVDLLRILKAGPDSFREAGEALSTILKSFQHGKRSPMARLGLPWRSHKIDKLLFAASKADHVSRNQRTNLESLLRDLLDRSSREIAAKAVEAKVMAISALRCTADGDTLKDGKKLSVVVGLPAGKDHEGGFWTGEVPAHIPSARDWHQDDYGFMDFLPRRLLPGAPEGFENMRLDEAIKFLIGDRFS